MQKEAELQGKTLENSDPSGPYFSVASTGTTNAATYNTATFNGARPGSNSDPPFDSEFMLSCQLTDDAGSAPVTLDVVVNILGITV